MLGLDAGAAGFDFSMQSNEQEGHNRKNMSRQASAMDGSKSGSSNIWGAIKTSMATTMAEGINALSVRARAIFHCLPVCSFICLSTYLSVLSFDVCMYLFDCLSVCFPI